MSTNHDTSRARQRAARALAKADGIKYTTALRRIDAQAVAVPDPAPIRSPLPDVLPEPDARHAFALTPDGTQLRFRPWRRGGRHLLILGPAGAGKTVLAHRIAAGAPREDVYVIGRAPDWDQFAAQAGAPLGGYGTDLDTAWTLLVALSDRVERTSRRDHLSAALSAYRGPLRAAGDLLADQVHSGRMPVLIVDANLAWGRGGQPDPVRDGSAAMLDALLASDKVTVVWVTQADPSLDAVWSAGRFADVARLGADASRYDPAIPDDALLDHRRPGRGWLLDRTGREQRVIEFQVFAPTA